MAVSRRAAWDHFTHSLLTNSRHSLSSSISSICGLQTLGRPSLQHSREQTETFSRRRVVTSSMAKPSFSQRIQPGPGQESVWDYPRPPRLERCSKHVRIVFNGVTIADSHESYRVLETSHPPVYYIPQKDIKMSHLSQGSGSSFCEWKGRASYWTVTVGDKTAKNIGWSYESPTSAFLPIKSHIAFYAAPMDSCQVNGNEVTPQPGGFYGGWITSDIVGPFKGSPGTWGW
eukprot:TRINITY_DN16522_c0_g1_i1.p1 TRINITY_DN16522_c0_g1~~TRINITY_DN16522_c0_g1_i1.p1  ORF type:complete len:250 (-),score=26.22 TRINITY_DN16522_c0_g1_i1:99-788(-)